MKHSMQSLIILFIAVSALFVQAGPIQDAINAAAPGDVVTIQAGVYNEPVTLKDGVFLVGEGADTTILDGGGANVVIKGAKNAAVAGLTIQNGKIGVDNNGDFIGVFNCRIQDTTSYAIHMQGGSGVIANNELKGGNNSRGILCSAANPLIINNLIQSFNIGLMAWNHYIPSVQQNIFVDNGIAIQVGGGASVALSHNRFSGNKTTITGQELSATDNEEEVDLAEVSVFVDSSVAQIRELMNVVKEKQVSLHPVVIYDLSETAGSFGVITLFPWSSFGVASSTPDTKIITYDAYDTVTQAILDTAFVKETLPKVEVKGAIEEKEAERYVLDTTYVHPASYTFNADGSRTFKRGTNFSRIEVIIPTGFTVLSVNLPSEIKEIDGKTVVTVQEVGMTQLEIELAPAL